MAFFRGFLLLPILLYAHSAEADSLAISCISDAGAATSTSSCSAILPKCVDLKTSYEKTVKNFLSWKIWGYYNGKNIDLDSSVLNASKPTLSGVDLMYPICSVVGHKIQYTGSVPPMSQERRCDKSRKSLSTIYQSLGFEYANQTIGKKGTCGIRPDTTVDGSTLNIKFVNGSGNLWNSYMIGAYPWLIRKNAYDVLTALKPDFSNLSEVISDASVKADLTALNTTMTGYYTALSSDSKASCSAPASDIVTKCTTGKMVVTDPSNRICTLVKAQLTLNTGTIPNVIVKEIMARVQTQYDSLFSKLLTFTVPTSQNLWNRCKDTGGLFKSKKAKMAETASCLTDGADFYSYGNGLVTENGCSGTGGAKQIATRIRDGASVGAQAGQGDQTVMLGFAGVIESIIRRDICLQSSWSDQSVCDTVNIPDKPDGVQ